MCYFFHSRMWTPELYDPTCPTCRIWLFSLHTWMNDEWINEQKCVWICAVWLDSSHLHKRARQGDEFDSKSKGQMTKTWKAKHPVYKVRRKELRLSQSLLLHLYYSGMRYGSIVSVCVASTEPPLKEERNAMVYLVHSEYIWYIPCIWWALTHIHQHHHTCLMPIREPQQILPDRTCHVLSFSTYTDHKDTEGLLTNSYFDISSQKY